MEPSNYDREEAAKKPSNFKFDEIDYQDRQTGGEGLSFDSFTDDEEDHYFRLPPTTTVSDTTPLHNLYSEQGDESISMKHNARQPQNMHAAGQPPPPPPPPSTMPPRTPRSKNTSSNAAASKNAPPPPPPPPPPPGPPPSKSNPTGSSPSGGNKSNRIPYNQRSQQQKQKQFMQSQKQQKQSSTQTQQQSQSTNTNQQQNQKKAQTTPTLEPYLARLEKFELFSTPQCYYLVACDKHCTGYRIMKMDRTLIESPKGSTSTSAGGSGGGGGVAGPGINTSTVGTGSPSRGGGGGDVSRGSPSFDSTEDAPPSPSPGDNNAINNEDVAEKSTTTAAGAGGGSPNSKADSTKPKQHQQQQQSNAANQQQHSQKSTSTFRRLSDFIFEDPAIYSPSEIRDILDMINDGNLQQASKSGLGSNAAAAAAADSGGGGVGNNSDFSSPHNNHHHHNLYGTSASSTSFGGDSSLHSGLGGTGSGLGHHDHTASSSSNSQHHSHGKGGGGSGLKPICKAYGILGFIRFLDCYYLTLITKRAKVGSIGGNSIYTIKSTETFPLKPAERLKSSSSSPENYGLGNDPSSMLLSMWNRGKRSVGLGLSNREIAELRYQGLYQVVDLTKNFFFSYTYDLTRSLQENFLAMTGRPFPPPPFKDMYAWNFFLTRELEECTHSMTSFHWVLPVVHGAFIQRKLHDYGRSLNLVLLARRSRHFAGTRYLKRGVSDRGKVANDVEHEQIIHDESSSSEGVFSSYLQIRGSIPTFWTQESSVTMPKPPIVLNRVDPTYQATQAHFEDLLKRYGSPIIVVDLVKQSEKREREVIVGNEFRNAIDYINCHIGNEHKILYCALDYSHISKHRNLNVSSSLNDVATWSVNQTGFFCSSPQWKIAESGSIEPFDEGCYRDAEKLSQRLGGVLFFPMEQMGILRTNCIDCLDRTNVAQFSAGVEALGQQLVVMGIRSSPKLDPSSIIVRMLIDMYVEIGDQIALQYGGSEAHKKVASAGATSNVPGQLQLGKHKELLTSIRRYYSNAFTDRLKQDAMNLFLGYYLPSQNTQPLWDLDNDYYLHNFHVNAGRGSLQSMKAYQSMFGVDWSDLEDDHKVDQDRHRAHRRNESVGSTISIADDPARIDRVKQRCIAQNYSLSVWWKVAIQNYLQQRMWMQLGGNHEGSSLPPRFERLYRPTELSHFDKVFARPWATPSRLSHEDQHKSSLDDGELGGASISPRRATPKESKITLFDERVQSSKGHDNEEKSTEDDEGGSISLQEYVHNHGFSSKSRSSLTQLIEAHAPKPHALSESDQAEKHATWRGDNTLHYLGGLKEKAEPCPKIYADYASNNTMPRRSFRPGRREDFAACLSRVGFGIDSNDVQGIRKLAESAHICQELQSGPYRGLNQNESAVRVATTIHGYFNYLEEKVDEGDLSYNEIHPPELLETLKQSNLYSVGVTETVYSGWKHQAKAEKSYSEIVDMSSIGYRRSDVTTDSSMKLYSSFFDQSSEISALEQAYAAGERLPSDPTKPLRRSTRPCEKVSGPDRDLRSFDEASFILKAASRGINIRNKSSRGKDKEDNANIIEYHSQRPIPAGFEQINEDLFARKDNKFMVFNGSAVDSWKSPPQPVTKTHRGIDILAALK